MAKKSLGYVELEWACPNCSTRNPGSQKTCLSCGMPQPEDVKFEQKDQETLITDEKKLAQAKVGPDIHCHYCGSRNPATATNCSQCGADLSEGAKRDSGKVLGAHRDKPADPIECPACGAANQPDASKCVQCGASLVAPKPKPKPEPIKPQQPSQKSGFGLWAKIGLAVALLALCACGITFFVLLSQTDDINGTVDNVSWQRVIVIEGLVPVSYEDWRDKIPSNAEVGTCTSERRGTQSYSDSNTVEVCGTPYTVETGSGYGEVTQDCEYEVYDDYCKYTIEEWREVDKQTLTGNDFNPSWPLLSLPADKREGDREETYTCHFTTESGNYAYSTSNPETWQRCQLGSKWILKVNTLNMVTDIESR